MEESYQDILELLFLSCEGREKAAMTEKESEEWMERTDRK